MDSIQNTHPEEHPIKALSGIGEKLAANLEKLSIVQVKDLLFHFPYRFEDRTQTQPIGSLRKRATVLVIGRIISVRDDALRRRALTVKFQDDSGAMQMVLFHYSFKQKSDLERASWIRCFGEARYSKRGYEMVHPEYSTYRYPPPVPQQHHLTPVYGLTEGIAQSKMRELVNCAIKYCKKYTIPEILPDEVIRNNNLCEISSALEAVHTPMADDKLEDSVKTAMHRLIFEELLSFQVARWRQKKIRHAAAAPPMQPTGDLSSRLRNSLTFSPTNSQREVIREIITDLKKSIPMLRLVQGDVGSGKTLVAAAAAAWAVDAGYQVAIMAPTELLAEQHEKSFHAWFAPLGIEVILLTGRLTQKIRTQVQRSIKSNQAKIAIGTHALFQEGVEFKCLGLVIVDEQHRFGVGQRFALREKGMADQQVPHQLVMTATPIPRTLAMAFYTDLDVSNITELPPGRIPVQTQLISAEHRKQAIHAVAALCDQGQQAYWVCPLIDKSEVLEAEAAVEAEKFVKKSLPDRRIALIHGRIKSDRRDQIMKKFRAGEIDVLVATTVIEVGVDVPNASLMVIESAERLGLSQLHQLRGRVGRGAAQAACLLIYKGPLSETASNRLQVMNRTTDGFKIAEKDLELRGAGELLGTRQTGAQLFRIAEFRRDQHLLGDVGPAAELIVERYPQLIEPLIRRWTQREGQYSAV